MTFGTLLDLWFQNEVKRSFSDHADDDLDADLDAEEAIMREMEMDQQGIVSLHFPL